MSTQRQEQCFMHVATYHVEDLRTAGILPEVPEITPALADTLSTRLGNVCAQHGWNLIDIQVLPDRIEALLTGKEPSGENGEAVAAALDGAVYGEMSTRAAEAMN